MTPTQGRNRWNERRLPDRFLGVVALVTGVALASTYNRLPFNIAFADIGLVCLGIVGLRLGGAGVAPRAWRVLTLSLAASSWLYLLGQTLGFTANGVSVGGLVPIAVDIYPVGMALALVPVLLQSPTVQRQLHRGLFVALVLAVLLVVLSEDTYRTRSVFASPNFGSHLIVTLTYVSLRCGHRRQALATAALLPVILFALVRTGSFGGLVAVGALIAYEIVRLRAMTVGALRVLVTMLLAALLLAGGTSIVRYVTNASFDDGSGLSSERLERSQDTRLDLWSQALDQFIDRPIGSGSESKVEVPGGRTVDVHNDPLAFALKGGVLALLGYIICVAAWWRFAPRSSSARALLVMLVVTGCLREGFNFRHLWVGIALLCASEIPQRAEPRSEASRLFRASNGPRVGGAVGTPPQATRRVR